MHRQVRKMMPVNEVLGYRIFGGYYIGCAADYIMANRNTLTGSIGVISGQFIDMTQLMDKIGIKSTTIHSGRNKIMGSPSQPMTEEQRKIMQSISDECYDQFTSIVAESRELSKEKVIELAKQKESFSKIEAIKDLSGNDRVIICKI